MTKRWTIYIEQTVSTLITIEQSDEPTEDEVYEYVADPENFIDWGDPDQPFDVIDITPE